ncbi:MAG: NAD-dependent epimerase/dehydratase family protein [Myxococcota bacterium]
MGDEQIRVLVAGGAGFIGSHMIDRHIREGHRVIAIDDLSTGRRENLAHLSGHPGFELLVHDVLQPFDVAADFVYHFACPASPVDYQKDPIRTARINFEGTRNVLEASFGHGARVLFASSSEVYGNPLEHPQRESYNGNVDPQGSRACYAEGKRIAETLCADYRRSRGLDVRVARIFNAYGPRMRPDDGRVIPTFLRQARAGEPLTIHGDGSQTRSFCYIDDLVEGLFSLMNDAAPPPAVNLGSDEEVTIRELAGLTKTLLGGKPQETPLRLEGDPERRCPDLAQAPAMGRTPLSEGLTRLAAGSAEPRRS